MRGRSRWISLGSSTAKAKYWDTVSRPQLMHRNKRFPPQIPSPGTQPKGQPCCWPYLFLMKGIWLSDSIFSPPFYRPFLLPSSPPSPAFLVVMISASTDCEPNTCLIVHSGEPRCSGDMGHPGGQLSSFAGSCHSRLQLCSEVVELRSHSSCLGCLWFPFRVADVLPTPCPLFDSETCHWAQITISQKYSASKPVAALIIVTINNVINNPHRNICSIHLMMSPVTPFTIPVAILLFNIFFSDSTQGLLRQLRSNNKRKE